MQSFQKIRPNNTSFTKSLKLHKLMILGQNAQKIKILLKRKIPHKLNSMTNKDSKIILME